MGGSAAAPDALWVPPDRPDPAPPGPGADATDRILQALSIASGGLSLNDVATAVGKPVALVSSALMSLEQSGRARFHEGLWHPMGT